MNISHLRATGAQILTASMMVALTSCSGGGQAPITRVAVTGSPSLTQSAKASASLRIVVPSAKANVNARRGRAYVASTTASIQIALTPTSGSTGTATTISQNLAATASGCTSITGGGYACTITIPSVSVGGYTVAFKTYDGALDVNGNPTGNVLSANQTFPFTVVANTVNVFSVTLDGIPKSIAFVPVTSSSLAATSASTAANPAYTFAQCAGLESPGVEAVNVYALDADSNEIIGPGAPTVTLMSASSSVVVGTPTTATPNLFALSGPTPTSGAPGTFAKLTATAMTPAATAADGGVPTMQVSLSVGLTLAACGVVNVATDASPGTAGSTTMPPGAGPGAGSTSNGEASGDLRYVLQNAPAGARVVFALGSGSTTVMTAAPLPPIEQSVVIDGNANVVIDGGNATTGSGHRVFFVDTGTVVLRNLAIANALAQGGPGGGGGQDGGAGGGGCGCGGGIFVNQVGAAVSLQGVSFSGMSATGGSGGSASGNGSAGGGGGLGFAGGDGGRVAGGGGGGVLEAGTPGSSDNSFTGGMGGYGGGGDGVGSGATGTPGAGYGSNAAPTGIDGTLGGGGGASSNADGGIGGFGGGGGGGADEGGVGGFGAGGGGSQNAQGSAGGPFGGGSGGDSNGGSGGGGGGGGAALGAAVFVNLGSLSTVGSSSTVPTVIAGAPGADFSTSTTATGGQSDKTPVFNHAGTVNGAAPSETNGAGVPGAL